MQVATMEEKKIVPLVVDLDGTLIKTDLLGESILQCIKKNPLTIFNLFVWLIKGKAELKSRLAAIVKIDVQTLPYNIAFVSYLKNEYYNGRTLILATASHTLYANQIASYVGIFSETYATDSKCNLKGSKKLECLETRFGENGFDYAGDSKADLKIFSKARNAILVHPENAVLKKAAKNRNIRGVFNDKKNQIGVYLKAIRIHQWLKNILIFVPILTSHNWFDVSMILKSVVGFLALCFCASGTYILNDLFDLNSDRNHPRKRDRPFAAGDISIVKGLILSSLLLTTGVFSSYLLGSSFGFIVTGYIVLTLAYSLFLKTYALIDTILLASLYTIRVIAGAVLIEVNLSFWLLTFSVFIFYCLALLKRVTELQTLNKAGNEKIKGRGYTLQDENSLRGMGISSGLLSIVVFALYINSADVLSLYPRPQILWFICPLLLYWINMLWLKTGREEMHDDPIVFTIKDRSSQVIFVLIAFLLFVAAT